MRVQDEYHILKTRGLYPESNGNPLGNSLGGTLFNSNGWADSILNGPGGTSYDIQFPRGTLSNERWRDENFGTSVANRWGYSTDLAIQADTIKRNNFIKTTLTEMTLDGFIVGAFMIGAGSGLVVGVAAAGLTLAAAGAMVSLMLRSAELMLVMNGTSIEQFKSWSLAWDLNQLGFFIGLYAGGVEQDKAIDYSSNLADIWNVTFQDSLKINFTETHSDAFDFAKKALEGEKRNRVQDDILRLKLD